MLSWNNTRSKNSSDVKTASNEDLETYIEMTKMFIKELRISPKYKASVNNQLLNSLRIINGEPIVKAGPATNYQKLLHWLPRMVEPHQVQPVVVRGNIDSAHY